VGFPKKRLFLGTWKFLCPDQQNRKKKSEIWGKMADSGKGVSSQGATSSPDITLLILLIQGRGFSHRRKREDKNSLIPLNKVSPWGWKNLAARFGTFPPTGTKWPKEVGRGNGNLRDWTSTEGWPNVRILKGCEIMYNCKKKEETERGISVGMREKKRGG